MTPLSWIMHQVAKTIHHRNFFYIHILKVTKTTKNAFSMTLLSRIMHQAAKIIIYENFSKTFIYIYIAKKTNSIAISMIMFPRLKIQVT